MSGGIHARDWVGWFVHRAEINQYLLERGYDTKNISVYGLTAEGYSRLLTDTNGDHILADNRLLQEFTHWKSPTHGEWVIRTILGE